MKKKRNKKNNKFITIMIIIVIVIGYIFGDSINDSHTKKEIINENIADAKVRVHYLDVGQADSIFIEMNNESMLIDAGEKDNSDKIINYIKSLGYKKIDYLVATHPHADHIGGMKDIVNSFDIGSIYMPKVTTNTKTYENLLKTIASKDKKIKRAKAGINIIDTGELKVDIIAPNSDSYDEINNYSACIKLTYKDISYLFMGDAEKLSEDEINTNIKADIIKVGHHGSSGSSSLEFLNKVKPSYAVISVGEGNSYNHPHKEALDRYKQIGATIYRTDINGNIIIETDGNKINIVTEK